MMSSLTLFHFTQVFPWRRPWIRAYWKWLLLGYVVVPFAVAVPVSLLGSVIVSLASLASSAAHNAGSDSLMLYTTEVGEWTWLSVMLVGLPLLFVVGLVVPFAALMSLYKSWIEAKRAGEEAARITTFWLLVSQMAGGVLAILIIPLLSVVAPAGPAVTIAAALLFAFGLLMPVAFAAGVWKYSMLELDPEAPPSGTRPASR
jgi:hypothetical protein